MAAVFYAVGYPLAIWGHNAFGWVLVTLGGPFLLALGVVVIRRVHAATMRDERTGGAHDADVTP